MLNYIIRRLLLIIPTIFGLSILVFCVLSIGGGVAGAMQAQTRDMEPEQRRIRMNYLTVRYGLNQPLYIQYFRWMNQISPIGYEVKIVEDKPVFEDFGFKKPDFGNSFSKNIPVISLIKDALPITVMINLISLPFIYFIAITSGVYMAKHRGNWFDVTSGSVFLALWSVPTILAGVLLIGYLASKQYLMWFPAGGLHDTQSSLMSFFPSALFVKNFMTWAFTIVGILVAALISLFTFIDGFSRRRIIILALAGACTLIGIIMFNTVYDPDAQTVLDKGWFVDSIWHLILPIICLSYGSFAFISKIMRSSLLDALSLDYIRTARAKGVSPKNVLWAHGFRNSLIPLITIAAFFLPALLAGSVVVEKIFSIPGMGTLLIESIYAKDREVIMAVVLMNGVLTMTCILIADICYAIADPRVTYD